MTVQELIGILCGMNRDLPIAFRYHSPRRVRYSGSATVKLVTFDPPVRGMPNTKAVLFDLMQDGK